MRPIHDAALGNAASLDTVYGRLRHGDGNRADQLSDAAAMKPDFPIDEMLAAADAAKTKRDAVWVALKILECANGYIILPMNDQGDGWRPDLGTLKRRARRRAAP